MSGAAPAAAGPIVAAAPDFTAWLTHHRLSLVLSTYQAGRLMFVGQRPDGRLRAHERQVEFCQGIWTDGQDLWASSRAMLWRFRNALPPCGATEQGADRLFVPREARVTGTLDVHDMAVGRMPGMAAPAPVFVATLWNCLATLSDGAGFRPLWRPPFVSALVAEDRCHLNGMAMRDGTPAYVTAVAATDAPDAWRAGRIGGGVVVRVADGAIVARGLSMPHSPRLHRGRLWLLNAACGEFGWIDQESGRFNPVGFCPGFARGLALIGRHAVIGLSRPRGNATFEGLPLAEALAARDVAPRCGVLVLDIETGAEVTWLRFEHTIEELYDVLLLPGVRQGEAVGLSGEALAGTGWPEAPAQIPSTSSA